MDEKLSILSNNKIFLELDNNDKTKILEKTIFKIKNTIEILKLDSLKDEISTFIKINNDKKIDIYNIVLKKLEDFKNSYK